MFSVDFLMCIFAKSTRFPWIGYKVYYYQIVIWSEGDFMEKMLGHPLFWIVSGYVLAFMLGVIASRIRKD